MTLILLVAFLLRSLSVSLDKLQRYTLYIRSHIPEQLYIERAGFYFLQQQSTLLLLRFISMLSCSSMQVLLTRWNNWASLSLLIASVIRTHPKYMFLRLPHAIYLLALIKQYVAL